MQKGYFLTFIAIIIAILIAEWLCKFQQNYARPITESGAADLLQPPTNVEEFLDRYPNV